MEKFITLRDDTDLLLALEIGPRRFAFVEIMDMDDACGRDNEGYPRYCGDVAIVDLEEIGPSNIASAMKSCGWDGMPSTPIAVAEACYQYGAKAPMWSQSGGNRRELLRAGKREARELAGDASEIEDRMSRPVNAIGSTANEYMRGDLDSAISRGVFAGRKEACIMAKMYGMDQCMIDDARPADWLPYLFGFMAGKAGQAPMDDPDLAPEYHLGFERGQKVRAGAAPQPGWIK
ncbi:MAG: hypothetical protein WC565_07325 [Parcubacteria group bacterium]